ncbi:hypothetical protein OsI_18455 [Oryza sativa Indica Group]|uniref:PDZ domain-containing protein n=1 Tax=Oryza sativa subsp. indica TaxID=39946 RepID=B8AY72_ORYSI|nr:hypothetical protein OsI_18455 [Oryza sativa Indica Group]
MAPVAAEEDDVPRLQEPLRTVRGRGNEQDSKGRSHCSRSPPASPSSERAQGMKRRRKMTEADHSCEDGEEKVPEKMNEGEEEEEVSSALSSPLHMPLLPFKFSGYDSDGQEILEPPDMDIVDAYQQRREEFQEKRGGKPLARCSGFLVDWDETRKKGIVMTTSDIICSKSSLDCWSGEDECCPNAEPMIATTKSGHTKKLIRITDSVVYYAINVQVYVHLLDDTTVEARLIYSQTHYNLALFEIALETPSELPTFSSRVDRAQHIFKLGRDENLYLRISHGRVLYSNPYLCDRHHYMYVSSAIPEFGLGGLVIDLKGKVVSEGSILEKLGVRIGDIIEYLNGERIYDTIQLEELLLELCEGHFDNGNGLNSTLEMAVNVLNCVFFVAGPTCEEIPNLAPLGEDALREEGWAGDSHIPTADGASTSVPLDQVGPDSREEISTQEPLATTGK